MIFTLALVTTLLGTQQINCFPQDLRSNDRMVMSLALPTDAAEMPKTGTLFLSSGIDPEGRHESSEVMELTLLPSSAEDKNTQSVRFEARNNPSNFIVTMRENDIGKSSSDFSLDLTLVRLADDFRVTEKMICYGTVFSQ